MQSSYPSRLRCTCVNGRHDQVVPEPCGIHPVQTTMGDVTVSSAMRTSSAIYAPGWYEETLVFQHTPEGRKILDDTCRHHFEAVAKWFGGAVAIYEAGWREIAEKPDRAYAIDVSERLNHRQTDLTNEH
jgi:hypothetical protein